MEEKQHSEGSALGGGGHRALMPDDNGAEASWVHGAALPHLPPLHRDP